MAVSQWVRVWARARREGLIVLSAVSVRYYRPDPINQTVTKLSVHPAPTPSAHNHPPVGGALPRPHPPCIPRVTPAFSTNMTPSVLLCFLSLSAVTAINLEPGRSKPVRLFSVKRKFINSARTRLQLQDSKTARKILKRRIKLRKPSPSVSKSTQNKSNGISDSVIENINR